MPHNAKLIQKHPESPKVVKLFQNSSKSYKAFRFVQIRLASSKVVQSHQPKSSALESASGSASGVAADADADTDADPDADPDADLDAGPDADPKS